jgi:hypothetical protein
MIGGVEPESVDAAASNGPILPTLDDDYVEL